MPHHFDGRGFKIHYVEEGSGPSIVFAHGFGMDHTMFAAQFEELPDDHRCVAWDMRGHGRSACPPGPWSIDDVVDDLEAFIQGIEAAPCHLVGMSIGGMAAIRLALKHPGLLRSLTLIDTSADTEQPDRIPLYESFAAQLMADGVTKDLITAAVPLFYGEDFLAREPEVVQIHADRAREMPVEAHIEGLHALTGRDSVVGRLGELALPTLVVHGEQDAAIPMSQAETLVSGIRGARLVKIPRSGHTSPMEAPDAVNEALAEFVRLAG